jgi:hypothetical protein
LDDPSFFDGVIERIIAGERELQASSGIGIHNLSEIYTEEERRALDDYQSSADAKRFIRTYREDLRLSVHITHYLDFGDLIRAFLPGFYDWAAKQASRYYDKDKVLKVAEERQSIMLWYLRQYHPAFTNLLYDCAFFLAIHGQGEFGHTPKEIFDKLWKEHKPALKTGPLPKSKAASNMEIREFWQKLLAILEPGYRRRRKGCTPEAHRSDVVGAAVALVNQHVDQSRLLDEVIFFDDHQFDRSAKQVAICLTMYRFDKSRSTVERATRRAS